MQTTNVAARDVSLAHLHPTFRAAITLVLAQLAREGIPFQIFEGFRSPQRQRYLYSQGRTIKGAKVTNATAWQSYHQYGIASDLVLFKNGQWSWETAGSFGKMWDRMWAIGKLHGLEPLSFERPHLQLAGISLANLQNGKYPAEGDESWAENLESSIALWGKGAPPRPVVIPMRPALPPGVAV